MFFKSWKKRLSAWRAQPCAPAVTPAQALKEAKAAKAQPQYDYSGETLYMETPPHRGDLVTNIALGATLLWLPLTVAAISRAAFVQYRFTDKRLSVITTAPWKSELSTLEHLPASLHAVSETSYLQSSYDM